MSRLNVSRLMKLDDPAAQCDIQSVGSDGKLDDVGIFSLVRKRLTPSTFTHITVAGQRAGYCTFVCPPHQLRQLGDVAGDPSRLIPAEQLGRLRQRRNNRFASSDGKRNY